MNRAGVMLVLAGAVGAGGGVLAQPVESAGGAGRGLTIKDFKRVEQGRGDAGGLSKSLARGPATVGVPNDFSGVYQIPEDADTPYAGWFARVSGAMIAVFPRGEYTATRGGVVPAVPANTRFFFGSVPLNARGAGAVSAAERVVSPANERINTSARAAEPDTAPDRAPDAPLPVTVETAVDADGVRVAMEKLCADPVYRANRVRDLLLRAGRIAAIER